MRLSKSSSLKEVGLREAGIALQDLLSHAHGKKHSKWQSWQTSHPWRARCNTGTHSWELLARHAPRVDIELRLVGAICKVTTVINDTPHDTQVDVRQVSGAGCCQAVNTSRIAGRIA